MLKQLLESPVHLRKTKVPAGDRWSKIIESPPDSNFHRATSNHSLDG
jgi:hypothetical protein